MMMVQLLNAVVSVVVTRLTDGCNTNSKAEDGLHDDRKAAGTYFSRGTYTYVFGGLFLCSQAFNRELWMVAETYSMRECDVKIVTQADCS